MKVSQLTDLPQVQGYLARIGAEPRSIRTAVIKECHGKYWSDIAVIKISKEGEVTVDDERYAPTDAEKAAIIAECKSAEWPVHTPIKRMIDLPEMIQRADDKNIFKFFNNAGEIIMLQVRIDQRDGEKRYVPWTYWSDGQWRACEPEGELPLYNGHLLKEATTVFIHEGAKAARRMQEMIEAKSPEAQRLLEDHPWAQELQGAVHIGWIGGALSPYRTDWTPISEAGIKRAYIVADNDFPGKSATARISKQLRIPTFCIEFNDSFPTSFDLGDDFPRKFWQDIDGVEHYTGPDFATLLHPATWATDLIANPRGKPTPVLRDSFKKMWIYVEEVDMFVCSERPDILRDDKRFNRAVAGFSDTNSTANLLVRCYKGRSAKLCYRPDVKALNVEYDGTSGINLYIDPKIKATDGDVTPWIEYLEYLFPVKAERHEVMRWIATLIAHPEVRMMYGMLLVSEAQGVGKTTLGASILAPLVGKSNTGFPSEKDIVKSDYNGWMAQKRLLVVNEIYSGASWKAYHSLKSVITDLDIEVNEKFIRQYRIENWCHVLACSNSLRALKMENDDRRWFYPEVTETPWEPKKFIALRRWLNSGGLSIIKQWAEDFGDYVHPSEHAPRTGRKDDLIEESRSEAQREAAALAERANESEERPLTLGMLDVRKWLTKNSPERVFDSDYEIRKTMKEHGMQTLKQRMKIKSRNQYVMVNKSLAKRLQVAEGNGKAKAEINSMVREAIIEPGHLMEAEM